MSQNQIQYKGSISPDTWGPHLWSVLHSLPESVESVPKIRKCLENLCLPCKDCQDHYESFSAKRPPSLIKDRTEAFQWIFDLHNDVNTRLGKKTLDMNDYISEKEVNSLGESILRKRFNF
mgnify:FL=1